MLHLRAVQGDEAEGDMGLTIIEFFVSGLPIAQGSKRAFVVKGRAVMTENAKNLKPWRNDVACAAMEAVRGECEWRTDAPMWLTVRKDGTLKPSAPMHKTTAPDCDKLARSIGDALTGIAYDDDRQIIDLAVSKGWAMAGDVRETPGALVRVEMVAP